MLEKLTGALTRYWDIFIISLPRIGLALLIVIVGVFLAGWVSNIFRKHIGNKADDPLMRRFLSRTIKVIIIILVCFLGLQTAGLSGIAGAILATAGASAVVIGFAFKDIAENFIAGVILAFNRPFNVDETIQIDNTFGKVKDMAFRYTRIKTFDGRDIYIPNADVLKKPVINYTGSGFYRMEFSVGIAYESSIDKAMTIIQDCMDNADFLVQDQEHQNFVIEDNLSASSVDLKVLFWVETADYRKGSLQIRGKMIRMIKEKMEEAEIYLPCPIMEIKNYQPAGKLQLTSDQG